MNKLLNELSKVRELKDYVVQEGDSLYKISEELYGEGALWGAIYALNKHIIGDNPDLIYPGTTLKVL